MKKIIILHLLMSTLIVLSSPTSAQQAKAHLNHVALYVMDLQKSTVFYRDIVGLDTLPEPFHDGLHTWLKIGPGQSLHIIAGSAVQKEYYKNQHICFSVSSVEAFTEKLRNNNIEWEDRDGAKKTITIRVDKVKQIWLRDPDGYWVEINDAKD